MLSEFAQIVVFILVAFAFVFVAILFSRLVHPKKPTKEKLTTYECGEVPVGESWIKFNIRFYLIALIFIIFEIEVVFLFPWAVVFKKMGILAFVEMFIFLGILLIGFVFLWARGDLEWIRPKPMVPELEELITKVKDEKRETVNVKS